MTRRHTTRPLIALAVAALALVGCSHSSAKSETKRTASQPVAVPSAANVSLWLETLGTSDPQFLPGCSIVSETQLEHVLGPQAQPISSSHEGEATYMGDCTIKTGVGTLRIWLSNAAGYRENLSSTDPGKFYKQRTHTGRTLPGQGHLFVGTTSRHISKAQIAALDRDITTNLTKRVSSFDGLTE